MQEELCSNPKEGNQLIETISNAVVTQDLK